MRYLFTGILALAHGDQASEPTIILEDAVESTPDQMDSDAILFFAAINSQRDTTSILANPRFQELAKAHLQLPEATYRITPDHLALIQQRLAELQTKSAGSSDMVDRSVAQLLEFTDLPDQITNEIEFRQALAKVDDAKACATTPEQADLVRLAFRLQAPNYLRQAQVGSFTVQVESLADWRYLASYAEAGQADINFDYSKLPKLVSTESLPKIIASVNDLLTTTAGYDTLPPVVTQYFDQLQFDPNNFPIVADDDTLPVIVKSAQELNCYSYAQDKNSVYKSAAYDRVQTLLLGDTYLKQVQWREPAHFKLHQPGDFFVQVSKLSELNESIYDDRSFHPNGLIDSYLAAADYSELPNQFTLETLQQFLDVSAALDHGFEQSELPLTPSEVMAYAAAAARRNLLHGDTITTEQLPAIRQELYQVLGGDPDPDTAVLNLILPEYLPGSSLSGRIRLSLSDEPESGSILVSDYLTDSIGTGLIQRLAQQAEDIQVLGTVTTLSTETYQTWQEQRNTLLTVLSNGSPLSDYSQRETYRSFYAARVTEPNWARPQAWEDLVDLPNLEDQMLKTTAGFSEGDQTIDRKVVFLSQIDLSDLPTIALTEYGLAIGNTGLPAALSNRRDLLPLAGRKLDFRYLQHDVTPQSIDHIYEDYCTIEFTYGDAAGDRYLAQLNFSTLPQELTATTQLAVAGAIQWLENVGGREFVLSYLKRLSTPEPIVTHYPPGITTENIEAAYATEIVARYNLITFDTTVLPALQVSLSPPNNFEELLAGQKLMTMLEAINPTAAVPLVESYYLSIDWSKATSDVVVTHVADIESLRKKINQSVNAAAGDAFLVNFGMNQIERELVLPENLDKRVQFAEEFLQVGTGISGFVDSDIVGMYHMIAQFQVTRILEYCVQNTIALDDPQVQQYIARLQNAGADIPVTEGSVAKVLRGWQNPTYLLTKATDRLTTAEAWRTEWRNLDMTWHQSGEVVAPGFTVEELYDGTANVATVVFGDPKAGAKVDYMVRVGGGLTETVVADKFKDKRLVAESVGAYTTGASKPAELAIDNGSVRNYLLSTRDGMIIINAAGELIIRHRDAVTSADFAGNEPVQPLAFAKKLEDFQRLIKLAQAGHFDIMMGHLLINDGQLDITDQSSAVVDKRRVVVVMVDGRFGLVDFKPHITLLEVAHILQAAGVRYAVNCDTGYYDQANYYTVDGKKVELGDQDKDGTNNKLVFYREI